MYSQISFVLLVIMAGSVGFAGVSWLSAGAPVPMVRVTPMQPSPGLPTFAESGLPNYDASSWNGILVPTGTPRAIVDKLNAEIVKIMRTPGVFDRLAADGTTPTGSTPEEFTAYIKAEQATWGKVVREANIRVE